MNRPPKNPKSSLYDRPNGWGSRLGQETPKESLAEVEIPEVREIKIKSYRSPKQNRRYG